MTASQPGSAQAPASWWKSSSVASEVQALERQIDQKLSKAAQLAGAPLDNISPLRTRSADRVGSRQARPSSTVLPVHEEAPASASMPSGTGRGAVAASAAAAAVYTVTAAMDVAALREEVARLALQVQSLERQASYFAGEESEVQNTDCRRVLAMVKEQIRLQMQELRLELARKEKGDSIQVHRKENQIQPSSSSDSSSSVRQELDDLRARLAQLSRQVESQCQATALSLQQAASTKELAKSEFAQDRHSWIALREQLSADVSNLKEQLSTEVSTTLTNFRQEVRKDLWQTAMDVAQKAARDAVTEGTQDMKKATQELAESNGKATTKDIKDAARRAANDTAKEVAHVAALEAVNAIAEKAREAAREVAEEAFQTIDAGMRDQASRLMKGQEDMLAEMAAFRGERGSALLEELNTMLTIFRSETEEKQGALSTDMRMLQTEVQGELSAAVAAMSKEVTTSCSEACQTAATCQEEVQGRYSELLCMMNLYTSRFSNLRQQVDAMRQDGSRAGIPAEVVAASREFSLDGAPAELVAASRAFSFEDVSQSTSSVALRTNEFDNMAAETLRRQREVEAQVRRLRTEAANTEPMLQSLRVECEELRSSLYTGLERLQATHGERADRDNQRWEDKDEQVKKTVYCMTRALGEEFDKVHEGRLSEMVTSLGEEFDKANASRLSDMVAALGEEFDTVLQETDKQHHEFSDELRQNFTQLSSIVKQLLQRQVDHDSQLEALERVVESNPPQNADASVAVSVGTMELEAKLEGMAHALGEEFEHAHNTTLSESLTGMACALGEEFDKVHAEKQQTNHLCVEELQRNQLKLAEFVDTMMGESGKAYANLAEELKQSRAATSRALEDLSERQDAQRSKLESLQGSAQASLVENGDLAKVNGTNPLEVICSRALTALSDMPSLLQNETDAKSKIALQLGRELEKAGLVGSCCDMTVKLGGLVGSLEDKLVKLPQEVEALRVDHNSKLAKLAEALGEEFEQATASHLTNTMSDMACALGEEFDRVHAERAQPLEVCLGEMQQNHERLATTVQDNHDRLAAIVQDMQQEREVKQQVPDPNAETPDVVRDLCVAGVETLLDANTSFVDELRQNFTNLSNVVEDLLHRQVALASELEAVRAGQRCADPRIATSPQGSIARCAEPRSPVSPLRIAEPVTSQESTSDSKREPFGNKSPGGLSDAPSASRKEAEAVSNLASDLDRELSRAGATPWECHNNRVSNLPVELEVLRNEHSVKMEAMAAALGEEFEHIHINNLSDLACFLGEEFDKVHAERNEPLEGSVAELRQNQARLMVLVEGILERPDNEKRYTDFLDEFKSQDFASLSSAVGQLTESQASLSSELQALRQKSCVQAETDTEPLCEATTNQAPSDVKELCCELEKGPSEDKVEALRFESHAKIVAMAEALGEEFETRLPMHLADMASAIGDEFDKVHGEKHQLLHGEVQELQQNQTKFAAVHGEKHQLLQGSLQELQQNQAKLAAIVLRQEYANSMADFTDASAGGINKKPQDEYESLCVFVRAEIDQKIEALRDQLSKQIQSLEDARPDDNSIQSKQLSVVQNQLADSCKTAQSSNDVQLAELFRITREQAEFFDEVRQSHADVRIAEAQPPKAKQSGDAMSPSALLTLEAQMESQLTTLLKQDGPQDSLQRSAHVIDEARQINAVPQADAALLQPSSSCASPIRVEPLTCEAQEIAAMASLLGDTELPEPGQQATLQEVMDDELRRARLALEGMPTLGASQQQVLEAESHTETWDFPETSAAGDADNAPPLSSRWCAVPVPGLRSQLTEEVADQAATTGVAATPAQVAAPNSSSNSQVAAPSGNSQVAAPTPVKKHFVANAAQSLMKNAKALAATTATGAGAAPAAAAAAKVPVSTSPAPSRPPLTTLPLATSFKPVE